jgi:putative spermidine/putrescine transport system permease protein
MRRRHLGSALVVILCVLFFAIPLVSLAVFSFTGSTSGWTLQNYTGLFTDVEFWSSFGLSLVLAAVTTIVSLVIMVPTVLWVHLRAPGYRRPVEFTTLITFAVPPIALVIGSTSLLLDLAPAAMGTPFILVPFYVVLSFAFTYRALDAGVRAIDIATLVEAATSLGAGQGSALFRVILPNLRTSILGASFLTITVVLGEYVLSSLFLYDTLPVFMANVGTSQAQGAAALAFITVLVTWGLLIVLSLLSRSFGGGRALRTT